MEQRKDRTKVKSQIQQRMYRIKMNYRWNKNTDRKE